jgi:phosphatidylglycerol:prolipoprotein diacylglycerol transferase
VHPVLFRLSLPWLGEVPIYTWGVMLGVSLIVGWYLTLGRAQADGLPREMLANCYVITALAALAGARLLFVVTNPDAFESASVFELRSGGMVAYGGFLGGFLGSFAYLRWKKFPLLPWGDVGVLSLASGLFFTRIGCYLYGCDFGRRLDEGAPAWLARMGTFPHWPEGTVQGGHGSEAWAHHIENGWIAPDAEVSLPVHPTQLYEAAVGLGLLVLLLWLRGRQRFRGQIFLTFVFLYGFARFALELVRDDAHRGNVPPSLATHVLLAVSFGLFALAFGLGIAPAIESKALRLASRVAFAAVAVVTFFALRPAEYALAPETKLSTSQFLGLVTAGAAAWAFSIFAKAAKASPQAAMAPVAWHDPSEVTEATEPAKKQEAEEDKAPEADEPEREAASGSKPKLTPAAEAETEPAAGVDETDVPKKPAKKKTKKKKAVA